MQELTTKQVALIMTILDTSKNTFYKVSSYKKFINNNEFKEKLKEIEELEKIFGTVNNRFYYKNITEEVKSNDL